MIAPNLAHESRDGFADSTILITGGGGFLGRTVLSELIQSFPGRIVSINRRPLAEEGLNLPDPHLEVQADLRDFDRWFGLLCEADYVFWMAALRDHGASAATAVQENVEPLRAALAVLRDRPRFRRLVFASSISALDQPNRPHHPQPMTDKSPTCPRTPYGHSKLVSERLLAASGVPHTVLRLPFLYGPGFRRGSFLDFYRTVAQKPVLSAMRFTANLSLLYTGDVAGLLLRILAQENADMADASPFVLSDGTTYEVDGLISLVAKVHGVARPRCRMPALLGAISSEAALGFRRFAPPRPAPRGQIRLLLTYWSHAAFTRDYFVVDPSRFHRSFQGCTYTPIDEAMVCSFAGRLTR